MSYEIIKEKKVDPRPRFTYRPTEEKAVRIRALKKRHGKSFQAMTDMLYEAWFYKLQYETPMFNDLTLEKQTDYIARDVAQMPFFKRFFHLTKEKI